MKNQKNLDYNSNLQDFSSQEVTPKTPLSINPPKYRRHFYLFVGQILERHLTTHNVKTGIQESAHTQKSHTENPATQKTCTLKLNHHDTLKTTGSRRFVVRRMGYASDINH